MQEMCALLVISLIPLIIQLPTGISGQCCTNQNHNLGRQAVDEEAFHQFVDASTEFALKLYKSVDKSKQSSRDNVVLSPISIWAGLTAAWHGARGRNQYWTATALNFSSQSPKEINSLYHTLIGRLEELPDECYDYSEYLLNEATDVYKLTIVHKIFADDQSQLNDCTRKKLGSVVETLPLTSQSNESLKTINEWVGQQTNHQMDQFLPEGYIDEHTSTVLVTAVYFKSYWRNLFHDKTKPRAFLVEPQQEVQVATMRSDGREYEYGHSEQLQCFAFGLPYEGRKVRMVLLLPYGNSDIDDLISKLNVSTLKNLLSEMTYEIIDLWLPKFNETQSLTLNTHLEDLGLHHLFHHIFGDFSGFYKFSYGWSSLASVQHQARIEVTEAGTEDNPEMRSGWGFVGGKRIHINRPFVFLIQHIPTEAILYLGTIRDPH